MSRSPRATAPAAEGFLRSIRIQTEMASDPTVYPYCVPALRALGTLDLNPKVTFFVGENGTGKSTLIEAIAIACGFNAEGGTRNFRFSTRGSEAETLHWIRLVRGGRRERTGYFLRAESFFNVATEVDRLDREGGGRPLIDSYGGKSLHEQSHGESFLALVKHRFGRNGLYLLDEPEAALSPANQLVLLAGIHDLAERKQSQFIVATHSPIVLAYPGATIYQLSEHGIEHVEYEETDQFSLTLAFLLHRQRFFHDLFK